jgi:hypothetical protein
VFLLLFLIVCKAKKLERLEPLCDDCVAQVAVQLPEPSLFGRCRSSEVLRQVGHHEVALVVDATCACHSCWSVFVCSIFGVFGLSTFAFLWCVCEREKSRQVRVPLHMTSKHAAWTPVRGQSWTSWSSRKARWFDANKTGPRGLDLLRLALVCSFSRHLARPIQGPLLRRRLSSSLAGTVSVS